jgi:hypothetical protein
VSKISQFRYDFLVNLVAFPALVALVAGLLPRELRSFAAAGLAAMVALLLYIQLQSFWVIGRFCSWDFFLRGLQWGLQQEHHVDVRASLGGLVKLAAVMATIAGASIWARCNDTDGEPSRLPRHGTALCLAVGLLGFGGGVLGGRPYPKRVDSTLVHAIAQFGATDQVDTSEYDGRSAEAMAGRFRELTRTPPRSRDSRFFGKAAGADVVLIVLETCPARHLALDGDLESLPNLRFLRDRALVATRHYTTTPYTVWATFTILSSWYPSGQRLRYDQLIPTFRAPGLGGALGRRGYDLTAFGHDLQFDDGERLFRSLGVRSVSTPAVPGRPYRDAASARVERDRALVDMLKTHIAGSIKASRRYATVHLPQIGHGPLVDLTREGSARTTAERTAHILALQDAWIGEIIELLRAAGRLESTIIAVTADHGVRAPFEDPDFVSGLVDTYSFHVPLLIYAPQAIDARIDITHATSHIDIAPTILDLLGVETPRDAEQGLPLWDERGAERVLFFLGAQYLGADGYKDGDSYFMHSTADGRVLSAPALRFRGADAVEADRTLRDAVIGRFRRLAAIDQAWASRLAERTGR